jgi:hypothetical protein
MLVRGGLGEGRGCSGLRRSVRGCPLRTGGLNETSTAGCHCSMSSASRSQRPAHHAVLSRLPAPLSRWERPCLAVRSAVFGSSQTPFVGAADGVYCLSDALITRLETERGQQWSK